MPLLKSKTTKIGDETIIGELRFTKFIESHGKRIHENVYVVDISIPKPTKGWLSISHSLCHRVFESKSEANKFFTAEYKRIIKQKRGS